MTLTPLFFLPRSWRIWAYRQAMDERLLDTPLGALFVSVDELGIEFWYKGDTVIWVWPWRRKGRGTYISLSFTGTGEFGDAWYDTLAQLDRDWDGFFAACIPERADDPFVEGEIQRLKEGDLVALNERGECVALNHERRDDPVGVTLTSANKGEVTEVKTL